MFHNKPTGSFCARSLTAVYRVLVVIRIQCTVNIGCYHPVVCTCVFNIFIYIAFQYIKPLLIFAVTDCLVCKAEFLKNNRLVQLCAGFSVYSEPQQIILTFTCVFHTPLVKIKMRCSKVNSINGHQLFKVNTLCAVKGVIGRGVVIVIAVFLIVEAFIAYRYHMVRVNRLYIFTHFLCPVIQNIIFAILVRAATRLVG